MTYALKIRKATHGTGEQSLMSLDPNLAVSLSQIEENTHSFIMKYLRKDWKILEAGCGLGRWLIYLDSMGFNVSGIDISEDAINNIKKIKQSLDVRVGDILSMPYADNEFDALLSVGVVEHFADGPQKSLREMHRIIRDDGILILVVPYESIGRTLFHRPLCFIRYTILSVFGIKLEFEEYRFSARDILNHLKQSGWEIIEMSWVELTPSDRSYALWVDWGRLFRAKSNDDPFKLNFFGRIKKAVLSSISPWLYAEGIVIAARKKKVPLGTF